MICSDTVYDIINLINKVGLRKVVNKRKAGKYQNIDRDISILRKLGQGYSYEYVATDYNISKQRVHQILLSWNDTAKSMKEGDVK